MQPRYNNFHKHTHESNIRTLDCVVKPEAYMRRAKELGHTTYSTCEHGWAGKFLENHDLCQKHHLKMLYAAELYAVADRHQPDNSNFHIFLAARNMRGFTALNRIMSEANRTGFYYKPRVDLELLTSLNPKDFIVTSACIAGIFHEKGRDTFLEPLVEHFGPNLFFEVQAHNHPAQVQHNHDMVLLASRTKCGLIHANDSHYVLPEDAALRSTFLRGKGMHYGDEDAFLLDYPSYETIVQRYGQQNLLLENQINTALENTLVFDDCEELTFEKDIKMPTIYPRQDRNKLLAELLSTRWKEEKQHIPKHRHAEYAAGIAYEYNIVKETGMADYFLFNERMVALATGKYGGTLSRTGRGSAVSFYINKLLGLTEIDRFDAEVPLYPTRFMSVARILGTRSLPDIDLNWADVNAPIAASKELLGEDGIYYMYALGTMQEGSAFRNLCRAEGLAMDEYNEIAKDLDSYREDKRWKPLIEQAQHYVGTIESISPSPCSFLLSNSPISEQLGLVRVGDVLCAAIDGATSDGWKFLKNDYLRVRVWQIISDTYKLLGQPIPSIRELRKRLDDSVWQLYEQGLTATLNQADTDISTQMLRRYKPLSVGELSAFVAAIRPGFASLVNTFLDREAYSTGVDEIDEILKASYHFLLYQESIMAFLVWCGQPEEHTYDIIKKIAKKKFTPEEQHTLRAELLQGYKTNTGTDKGFAAVWQVVEDAARYSFNASHSLSVAWDSLYGAELKAHHPLEYFTTVLNEYQTDTEKTSRILSELPYFGICLEDIAFGKSRGRYTFEAESKTIYKSIASIKYCNERVAEELYHLGKQNAFTSFAEVLTAVKEQTASNSRQLCILITLGLFRQYGHNGRLLKILRIHDALHGKKQFKKDALPLGLTEEDVRPFAGKETDKLFKELDTTSLIEHLVNPIPNKPLSVRGQVLFEQEHLDYINYRNTALPENLYFVQELRTFSDKTKPYLTLYNLHSGEVLHTKITEGRAFSQSPFTKHAILRVHQFKQRNKHKRINGQWVRTNELEQVLSRWEVY